MQSQNIKFINLYIFVNIITHLVRDFMQQPDFKKQKRAENQTQSDFSPH